MPRLQVIKAPLFPLITSLSLARPNHQSSIRYYLIYSLLARKHTALSASRNLAVRKSIPVLPPYSPPLDGYNDDNPRHQERNHAHRDSEDEHCVQTIGVHCFSQIPCLFSSA